MDFIAKMIALAEKLHAPELIAAGINYAAQVKAAAARAPHILSEGETAELDQIHADALAAADRLDAKLDAAAQR